MSHFTRLTTVIHDQVLLEEALRQLQMNFQTGERVTVRGYRNRTEVAQVVVDTGTGFDIGFQRQEDRSFAILADWWGVQENSGVRQDTFVQDLKRTYAHLAVKKQVEAQGLIIEEERVLDNGEIELVISERV